MRNTNFKPFIFFSPIEAIAFSEAARNLLAWAGLSYPAESFTLVREFIRCIETSESHRLPLEDAEELFALLGTCAMSTEHKRQSRQHWRDCVRILSLKIANIPE